MHCTYMIGTCMCISTVSEGQNRKQTIDSGIRRKDPFPPFIYYINGDSVTIDNRYVLACETLSGTEDRFERTCLHFEENVIGIHRGVTMKAVLSFQCLQVMVCIVCIVWYSVYSVV